MPAPGPRRRASGWPGVQHSDRVALFLAPSATDAQTFDRLSPQVREFVRVTGPVLALTDVRVIDGTGAASREALGATARAAAQFSQRAPVSLATS